MRNPRNDRELLRMLAGLRTGASHNKIEQKRLNKKMRDTLHKEIKKLYLGDLNVSEELREILEHLDDV